MYDYAKIVYVVDMSLCLSGPKVIKYLVSCKRTTTITQKHNMLVAIKRHTFQTLIFLC